MAASGVVEDHHEDALIEQLKAVAPKVWAIVSDVSGVKVVPRALASHLKSVGVQVPTDGTGTVEWQLQQAIVHSAAKRAALTSSAGRATARWSSLRSVLVQGGRSGTSEASVRRVPAFGLLPKKKIPTAESHVSVCCSGRLPLDQLEALEMRCKDETVPMRVWIIATGAGLSSIAQLQQAVLARLPGRAVTIERIATSRGAGGASLTVQLFVSATSSHKAALVCEEVSLGVQQIQVYRRPEGQVSVHELASHHTEGVDNTGNVCVWPSEEVLAFLLWQSRHLFVGKRICELGGGMTCMAGLAIAASGYPTAVLLTDGNSTAVQNVQLCATVNQTAGVFGRTHVSTQHVLWDESKDYAELDKFDLVVAADCTFFQDFHGALVHTLRKLVAPTGQVWLLAPHRGDSLSNFVKLAEPHFVVELRTDLHPTVAAAVERAAAEKKGLWDDNLHRPVLTVLKLR